MKKVKRIIAGMAAAVMAFSTMSIGASASAEIWDTWRLWFTPTAPSSATFGR